MSIRESIAGNIVTTLRAATTPSNIRYVTREPFDFNKLSNAQFPALLIRTAGEEREDSTIGGSMSQRMGIISYEIVGYAKAGAIDTARNNLIETIEEALDVDRTRGGYAIDTQITSVEIDDGSIDPVGGVIITVSCTYQFTRGNT